MRLGTRLAGAILIALCVAAAVSSAAPQPQQQPANPEGQEAANQGGGDDSQSETFWQRTVSDPIALFTLVVAAFTGALAFSTVRLWISTAQLGRSAGRSAEAAERAIAVTRRIGEAQTIAYMSNDGLSFELDPTSNPPYSPIIECVWKNVGGTPAFNFGVEFYIVATKKGMEVINDSFKAYEERGLIRIDPGAPDRSYANPKHITFDRYTDDLARNQIEIRIKIKGSFRSAFGKVEPVADYFRAVRVTPHPSDHADGLCFNIKMARVEPDDEPDDG